jgi:hypothetical protein
MRGLRFAVVLAVLAGGCGRGGSVPVTGTVTLDGKPLDGATVVFSPEKGTAGTGGTGLTDTNGKYAIANQDGKRGLPPGRYRVMVSKAAANRRSADEVGAVTEADLKDEVPAAFNTKSELTFTVEDGQPIDIKLETPKGKKK